MSAKRPIIKFRDKKGRVNSRKLPPCTGSVWKTFSDIYEDILTDVNIKHKYHYDDIIEIIFEFKNTKKEKSKEI